MERKKIGDADFALLIGKDRSLVNRLRRGIVRPTLDVAAEIEALTGGEVTMQAWVDVPESPGDDTQEAAAA
jgi:DNA-binding transcriptional regulator YdaS (Cro superfamily)